MVKKSFTTIIIRGLGALLLFGLTLFITNNFEATTVGKYDISRSILNLFGNLALLGLNDAIIYYSGVFRARNTLAAIRKVYKKMLLIILGASLTLFLIYVLFLQHFVAFIYDEKEVGPFIFKTFCILGFHALTMLNIDLYRALNKIEISETFRNIFRHVFFFIGVIALVTFQLHHHLVDIFLLNYLFLGVVSTFFVFRSLRLYKKEEVHHQPNTKTIVKRSFPMAVSFAAFLLLQSTDILVLSKFVAFEKVAYYARAVQLTQLVSMVLYAVNTVFATKTAELFELKQFKKLSLNIKQATRLIFVLTAPVALIMFLFSDFFLGLFGQAYTYAGAALSILLIGQLVNSAMGSIGMYMNMTGEQNRLQTVLIIALIVNFILNVALIPKYGLQGAAVATAGTTIAWNVYCGLYLYRKRGMKTFLH